MKRKRLGQHFLADPETAREIVTSARVGPEDVVVEIGPGRGALTEHLARTGARIVAVELDDALADGIEARFAKRGVRLVRDDALTVDLAGLTEGAGRAVLIGNLPYRITGALMERILDAHALWRRVVVMVQREVGLRIAAAPGSRDFGILSVATAIRGSAECLFDVPPGRFDPPPKVHSSVVRIEIPAEPPYAIQDEPAFFLVVRTAFQQRRKKLRNALAKLRGVASVDALLHDAGVDPNVRPEQVTVRQFVQIAHILRPGAGNGVVD